MLVVCMNVETSCKKVKVHDEYCPQTDILESYSELEVPYGSLQCSLLIIYLTVRDIYSYLVIIPQICVHILCLV